MNTIGLSPIVTVNISRTHVSISRHFCELFLRIIEKYQGVKEFHMLARIGCCNFMVFSPFQVNVTYYHPLNQWLLGATNDNQGQTVMHHQCSETINHI